MSGPREVWMIEDLIGGDEYHDSEHEAKRWAGAGQRIIHLREVDDAADERDGVAPDFRRLSVAMAYDSGAEAGRSAERARVVGFCDSAETDAMTQSAIETGHYNDARYYDGRASAFRAVMMMLEDAATRGTTTEAP